MANLSKIKRDKMIGFLEELKKQHTDDASIRAFNEIENQLRDKKYGLVWEEHSEEVDELLKENIPVLTADPERRICKDESLPWNFIIEGDNLQALYLLEKTHKGRVDCIYIDPPYNTGNDDFIYDDKIIDLEDEYLHSKWLSFMERRLKIACNLLSKSGVIFISIDNNEYANLKLLCDEIFSPNSYVTTIHVELSATQGMKVKAAKDGNIVKNGEYVLVYSADGHKNIFKRPLRDSVKYDAHYNSFLIKSGDSYIEKPISEVIKECSDVVEALRFAKLLGRNDALPNKNISEAYEKCDVFREWINNNANYICRLHDTVDVDSAFVETMCQGKIYDYNDGTRDYLVAMDSSGKLSQRILLSEKLAVSDDFYGNYGPTRIRGDWWAGFYGLPSRCGIVI